MKNAMLPSMLAMALVCAGIKPASAQPSKLNGKVATTTLRKPIAKVDLAQVPAFQDAMADFKNARWSSCATKLEQLTHSGFSNDIVHYYLGQSYQRANQMSFAVTNYTWVSQYSTNPTLRKYSNDALKAIDHYGTQRAYFGQGNNFYRYVATVYDPAQVTVPIEDTG